MYTHIFALLIQELKDVTSRKNITYVKKKKLLNKSNGNCYLYHCICAEIDAHQLTNVKWEGRLIL